MRVRLNAKLGVMLLMDAIHAPNFWVDDGIDYVAIEANSRRKKWRKVLQWRIVVRLVWWPLGAEVEIVGLVIDLSEDRIQFMRKWAGFEHF